MVVVHCRSHGPVTSIMSIYRQQGTRDEHEKTCDGIKHHSNVKKPTGKIGEFECCICNQVLTSKARLENHERNHSKDDTSRKKSVQGVTRKRKQKVPMKCAVDYDGKGKRIAALDANSKLQIATEDFPSDVECESDSDYEYNAVENMLDVEN